MMKKTKGFTLIEMLMVLFIITLVVGVALFSMSVFKSDNDLESSTQALASHLNLAKMEAVFEQQRMGVAIDEQGYRFYRYDMNAQDWQRVTDDNLFKGQKLPKKTHLSVQVDNQNQKLTQSVPQIIMEQGQVAPFTLKFSDDKNQTFVVTLNELGEIVWESV